MSLRAPVELSINSVSGWCGTGGNAPLVFKEPGREAGREGAAEIDAGKHADVSLTVHTELLLQSSRRALAASALLYRLLSLNARHPVSFGNDYRENRGQIMS